MLIAVVTDLIFSTKITGTAKALQKPYAVARTLDKLTEHLNTTTEPPLVIIDLNSANLDTIQAIRLAKSHPSTPRVIAFLSHVEVELAQQAREAGADQILARSAFVNQLPTLLAAT